MTLPTCGYCPHPEDPCKPGWCIAADNANRINKGPCEIKGPYYPLGDVDWECRTHKVVAVLVDPSRYGASDLRREDFKCPVEQAAT